MQSSRLSSFSRHDSLRKVHISMFGLVIFMIALVSLSLASIAHADSPKYKEGEVIVKYKESTVDLDSFKGKLTLASAERKTNSKKKDAVTDMNVVLLTSETQNTKELIEEFKDDPNVEYAEPNYIRMPADIPNDALFSQQWPHNNTGQTGGAPDADIDAVEAWNRETDTTDTIVAVIDTGVRYTHQDLIANMWDGSGSCLDHDGNPIAGNCPYHGWDYNDVLNDNDNDPLDENGHGTNVASIIAARTNNSAGISGISRHNNLKIMALRFNLDTFTEVKAINFAKNNGAKVINASYGGSDFTQIEKDAIDNFPGIFVAAAGNNSSDNDAQPYYPCNLSSSNVICVGASDQDDNFTSFSNYSTSNVDIAAPGENVLLAMFSSDTSYGYGSGTSFSTPFVTGSTALLYSVNPTASIATIRNTLLRSSDHLSSLSTTVSCSRRLNLNRSLQSIQSSTIPIETCPYPVFRFWSDNYNGHFYTISEDEKNNVINNDSNWHYEGVGFKAYPSQETDTYPVYRFWSDRFQHHFYTISESEKNHVINNDPNWTYEGIVYYAYTSNSSERTPLYRFWSDAKQGHFFTQSESERDFIIATYPSQEWRYEGIAYYVPQ